MKERMTKFAIDLLNDVAEECERRGYRETGEKQRVLFDVADRLPKIMQGLVEEPPEDAS